MKTHSAVHNFLMHPWIFFSGSLCCSWADWAVSPPQCKWTGRAGVKNLRQNLLWQILCRFSISTAFVVLMIYSSWPSMTTGQQLWRIRITQTPGDFASNAPSILVPDRSLSTNQIYITILQSQLLNWVLPGVAMISRLSLTISDVSVRPLALSL